MIAICGWQGTLNSYRKTHKSALVRDRMLVLRLLDLGYSRKDCAEIVGCHRNTILNYIKLYHEGGLAAIRSLAYSKERHELHPIKEEVKLALDQGQPSTVGEAAHLLKEQFDYERSKESVRKLLHKLGFKRRKTGIFPGRIDKLDQWQADQEAYINKLEGLIQEAENEDIDLLFGDAAHFVLGKFSRFLWSRTPKYRPSGHGRFRINVYGGYDIRTNQVYSMYNEGYVDAEFMVEYFEWLRKEWYPDQNRPLHIVLDNARYQHCDWVKETAHELNIVLEFLPPYSPNLNLIERLWKYIKAILGKQFHDAKETFQQAVIEILETLNSDEHQQQIASRLTPNFQKFDHAQILGC